MIQIKILSLPKVFSMIALLKTTVIQFLLKMEKFTSKEITYNFNTKKGIIKDVRTQEGDNIYWRKG